MMKAASHTGCYHGTLEMEDRIHRILQDQQMKSCQREALSPSNPNASRTMYSGRPLTSS